MILYAYHSSFILFITDSELKISYNDLLNLY